MAKQYKTGLIITGDASGGIRAIKATDNELGKLNQGFDRGSRRSRQFNQDVNATSQGLTVLKRAAAPLAGAIAGMFAANTIQNQIDWGDQLQKTNLRIGASTESLSQYNYVAKLSGVEFGQLTTAWQRQTRRIAEAAAGTGVASKALDRLGLSAKDLNQLAPEEQFERIATAMQNVESSSERVALAQKLWDSEGVKLVQIVNQGTDAIAAMRAEADALGLTISQDTANAMATYNDEVDRLKFAAQGLSQTLAGELVPTMTSGLQATSAFIQELGGAEVILNELTDVIGITAALLAGRYAAAVAASTQKMVARELSLRAQIKAEVAATAASTRRTAAERQSAMALLSTARIEEQATRGTAAHAFALQQLSVARIRAAEAAGAHTAATNIATAATQRGTVAARGLASAYALVGGPLGLLVGGAGLLYLFRDELGLTIPQIDANTTALEKLTNGLDDMSQAAAQLTLTSLVGQLAEVRAQAEVTAEAFTKVGQIEGDGGGGFLAVDVTAQTNAVQELGETSNATQQEAANLEAAIALVEERLGKLGDRNREVTPTITEVGDANETAAAKAKELAESTAAQAKALEDLYNRLRPGRRETVQLARDMNTLALATAMGTGNIAQNIQMMGLLQQEHIEAQQRISETGDASEDASQRIANSFTTWGTVADNTLRSVDDAGRDAWLGLVDGSTSALDTVERAFEQTFANIAHMLTTQKLTFEVAGMMGLDTTGMPGGGGQSAGGFDLGSMGSLYNSAKNLPYVGDAISGAGSALGIGASAGTAAGYTGALGAATATGYGGAVGSAVSGAAASGGFMSAAGAAMPWIGAGMLIDNVLGLGIVDGIVGGISDLFGGGKSDPRLNISTRADAGQYSHESVRTGAFGAVGFSEGTKRSNDLFGSVEAEREWLATVAALDNLTAAAARTPEQLDAMTSAVQNMVLTSGDAQGAIDQLAGRTAAATRVIDEELTQTLVDAGASAEQIAQRFATARNAVDLITAASERLNLQYDANADGALRYADSLVQAYGSLDSIAAIQDAYYNAAFSDQERLQNQFDAVRGALNGLTDEAPRTVAELRALVEAQSQNGAASAQLAYDLMALAPALKETNAAVRQAIEQQYQEVLGRAPDASGLDYWFDVVASGSLTLEDALSSIANSAEAAEYASNGAASGIDNMSDALRAREQLEKQLLQAKGNTDALRQLEIDRLSDLENAEIDNLTALQRRLWAIEDEKTAQQEAERAQQERIRAIEQESQAWARARDQLAGFSNSIDGWLAQLDGTEKGMGTPRERLEASDADFWAQYEKALQGDRNAQQGITQYADRYIANLQEMYASSDPAVNGIAEIRDAMERLPELLTPEQFLADEFRGIVGEQTAQLGVMLDLNRDGVVSAIERSITADWSGTEALKTTLYQEMQRLGATSLTEQQVRNALAPHATDAEISRLIQRVDHNGDGIISQQEITGSRIAGLSMGIVSALESQFSGIDIDASGLIDYDEFGKAFSGMATDSTLEKLFNLVDANGDGQISYLESIAASSLTLAELGLGRQPGDTDDILGGDLSAIDKIIDRNPVSDSLEGKIDAAYHDVLGKGAEGAFQLASWARWLSEKESRSGQLHQAVAWANLPLGGREWLEDRGLYGDGTVPKFANGGVFTNSIVSAPTLFNMGLMGEEDPEAIVPLSRGAGGRLGIDATGLMRLPDGPMQLPMPEMPPLPQFPALSNNDVLQVLNDVRKELQETRKENKRLLELIGENTGDTVAAVEQAAARSEQQRDDQLDELETLSRYSKTEIRTT